MSNYSDVRMGEVDKYYGEERRYPDHSVLGMTSCLSAPQGSEKPASGEGTDLLSGATCRMVPNTQSNESPHPPLSSAHSQNHNHGAERKDVVMTDGRTEGRESEERSHGTDHAMSGMSEPPGASGSSRQERQPQAGGRLPSTHLQSDAPGKSK